MQLRGSEYTPASGSTEDATLSTYLSRAAIQRTADEDALDDAYAGSFQIRGISRVDLRCVGEIHSWDYFGSASWRRGAIAAAVSGTAVSGAIRLGVDAFATTRRLLAAGGLA